MDHLADELGVKPVLVPSLRRNPGWHDLSALWRWCGSCAASGPHIVHTHAPKAGTLGRRGDADRVSAQEPRPGR